MDLGNKLEILKEFGGFSSQFTWLLAIIVLMLIATHIVPAFLKRVKEGKAPRQKADRRSKIQAFEDTVRQAREELLGQSRVKDISDKSVWMAEPDAGRIFQAAEIDPEIAILRLSAALDKEARILAGSSLQRGKRMIKGAGPLKRMLEKRCLPQQIVICLDMFVDLGGKIIRRRPAIDDSEIRRVLKIGIALLKTMQALPRVVYKVFMSNIDLHSDAECRDQIVGVKGVIIEKLGPGNTRITKRIFPTSNVSYYRRGETVTWQRNFEKLWGKAYYIDPETQNREVAWESSSEFCGRHVENQKMP